MRTQTSADWTIDTGVNNLIIEGSEGFIIKITSGANNAIEFINVHVEATV